MRAICCKVTNPLDFRGTAEAGRARRTLARAGWFRLCLLAAWLLAPLPVNATPLHSASERETNDAPMGWRLADADAPVQILVHRRDARVVRFRQASEQFRIAAGQGTYAYIVRDITPSRVIPEWSPSLWVMSDRTGLQFMARVVFPRTADPRNGKPLTALLRGDIYQESGSWQQLRIHHPDRLLERQVRVLRSQYGPGVDDREAYVDMVVLNAYGGSGTSNVWLDELEFRGQVPVAQFTSHTSGEDWAGVSDAVPTGEGEMLSSDGGVRVSGATVVAEGGPIFPRVIESNGESLEWLQSLGFNAVQLPAAPTAGELREAARLELWLIAPPPNDGQITAAHDRVLAWHLGSGLEEPHLELVRERASQLRQMDPRPERPLIGEARRRIWNYSRLVNFLIARAEPIGTSLSLPRYGRWLDQYPTLARPGTPFWATIQTEPPGPLVDQWAALGLGWPLSLTVEPEQVRQMAYEAIASGARGLMFTSQTRLDGGEGESQRRARLLRQLNLELEVIEPWAAAGTRRPEVATDREDLRVSVLQTERAQLLLILHQDPQQQYTSGPAPPGPLSLVVPSGVNAPRVYHLQPGGLRTLTHRRVAGGIRVNLETRAHVNLIAITNDSLVLSHLNRALSGQQREVAQLHRDVAVAQWEQLEPIHRSMVAQSPGLPQAERWLEQARANLRHCELLLGSSDHAAGYAFADKALNHLASVRRMHWKSAAEAFPSPAASPYCVWLPALPLHWKMARRLQAGNGWSENLLPAGDFESLAHLQATGWQNHAAETRDLTTLVELDDESPQVGNRCLRLSVRSEATPAPAVFEAPPLRITTPPVEVRRGQLLRVHGWVRLIEPIQGGRDGLRIVDSLSGETLALRIVEPAGWQHFVLYRAAPRDAEVVVHFELTGVGDVWLDDVQVSLHEPIANSDG